MKATALLLLLFLLISTTDGLLHSHLPLKRVQSSSHRRSTRNWNTPRGATSGSSGELAVVPKAEQTSFYNISPFVVVAQAANDAALFGQRLLTHTRLPYYLMLFTVFNLLRDGEKRNRLDASTFKILGLTAGVSAVWLLCSVGLSPPVMLLVGQSFLATRKYGLSLPKISINPTTFANDPLPALYLATIIPAISSARPEMVPAIPLLAGTLVSLHSAAVVGPKRLASETYKKLNAMLVFFFAGAAVARKEPWRVLFAVPLMLGLLRGSLPPLPEAPAKTA